MSSPQVDTTSRRSGILQTSRHCLPNHNLSFWSKHIRIPTIPFLDEDDAGNFLSSASTSANNPFPPPSAEDFNTGTDRLLPKPSDKWPPLLTLEDPPPYNDWRNYTTERNSEAKTPDPLSPLPSDTRINPVHLPPSYSTTTKKIPCLLQQHWARRAGKQTSEHLQNSFVPSSRTNSSTMANNQEIFTQPKQME